jgi:hypothetical protein
MGVSGVGVRVEVSGVGEGVVRVEVAWFAWQQKNWFTCAAGQIH